jgi:hypothetical protein
VPIPYVPVKDSRSFKADRDALKAKGFPDIYDALEDFKAALPFGVPHVPVPGQPDVYMAAVDYPPHGANGVGVFLVTYAMKGNAFTMLTVVLRKTVPTP